uniref:TF-B3 domain-containing protein n=2 Tax=Davidia involucrata TaxID=16924 RepID=A0A5B7B912_DAVIN
MEPKKGKDKEEEVMRQQEENQTCMVEEEEHMAHSQYSISMPNPVDSSPMIKKRSPLKTKKKRVPNKPSVLKSKAKQVVSDIPKKSGSYRKKRTRIDDLYDNVEAKFSVMERAEEVMANLSAEFPCFVKCMLPSNVSYGFWLILPQHFCNLHLPRHDTTIILVDDCGEEYKTNFLVERHGLSAGWRGFSIAHRLLKGDRLVFHLVGPCKFLVNIVRVFGLDEVDAALCLMNLVAHAKRTGSDKDTRTRKKAKKRVEPLLLDIPRENNKKNSPSVLNSNRGLVADQSENNKDNFEVLEGSEISDHLQANELCCSQNLYLHHHLLEGISCRFAAGRVS